MKDCLKILKKYYTHSSRFLPTLLLFYTWMTVCLCGFEGVSGCSVGAYFHKESPTIPPSPKENNIQLIYSIEHIYVKHPKDFMRIYSLYETTKDTLKYINESNQIFIITNN